MAASIHNQMAVARVYADALFALADEQDIVDDVDQELSALAERVESDPQFAAFLTSGAIDSDRRKASLENMFRSRLNAITLNTLLVLDDHGRGDLLPALNRCFTLAAEKARDQVEAVAISAVELSPAERDAITQLVQQKSGKNPLVDFQVDPAILGGLILRIGDWQFDDSLRQHLSRAHAKLRARADRGLSVGSATP